MKKTEIKAIIFDVGRVVTSELDNGKVYAFLSKTFKIEKEKLRSARLKFRRRNLIPAQKIGFNAIHFKNNKQLFSDLRKFGVKI